MKMRPRVYSASTPHVRTGNLRRAIRQVAKSEGIPKSRIENVIFRPKVDWGYGGGPVRGLHIPGYLAISTGMGGFDEALKKPVTPFVIAAHELAHAKENVDLGPRDKARPEEHTPSHRKLWDRYERAISKRATELARKDRSYVGRKSAEAGGGGDIQVAAHERNGKPVAAYTRSRPGR